MTTSSTNSERYARARQRVEEIRGFYVHLINYLIFVPVFIFIDFKTTSFPWAVFPIVGWGIGLLGHAAQAFNYNIFFGKDWEERKIKQLLDNEKF